MIEELQPKDDPLYLGLLEAIKRGFTQASIARGLGMKPQSLNNMLAKGRVYKKQRVSLERWLNKNVWQCKNDSTKLSEESTPYNDPLDMALMELQGLVDFMSSPLYQRAEKIRKYESTVTDIYEGVPARVKAAHSYLNGQKVKIQARG